MKGEQALAFLANGSQPRGSADASGSVRDTDASIA
jgi:hypothetical protein